VMLRALLESSGWSPEERREASPRPRVRSRRAKPGDRAQTAASARAKRSGPPA
jgi:hypothetical protein